MEDALINVFDLPDINEDGYEAKLDDSQWQILKKT